MEKTTNCPITNQPIVDAHYEKEMYYYSVKFGNISSVICLASCVVKNPNKYQNRRWLWLAYLFEDNFMAISEKCIHYKIGQRDEKKHIGLLEMADIAEQSIPNEINKRIDFVFKKLCKYYPTTKHPFSISNQLDFYAPLYCKNEKEAQFFIETLLHKAFIEKSRDEYTISTKGFEYFQNLEKNRLLKRTDFYFTEQIEFSTTENELLSTRFLQVYKDIKHEIGSFKFQSNTAKQLLYTELKRLNKIAFILDKKTWYQLFYTKIADMVTKNLISQHNADQIFESILRESKVLLD